MISRGKLSTFLRHSLLWLLAAISPLFIYNNCGDASHDQYSGNSESINTTAVLNSLRNQKNTILSNKCVSCHNELTTDNNLRNILDTEYLDANSFINPGSPQTSPLYLRIIDGLMPPTGSPDVTDAELVVLRDWIAAEGGDFDTYIGGTPDVGAPSDFTAVRAVMTQHCTSCHRAGGVAPRLDVDAATMRGTMYQGRRLVIPNNAAGSLLLQSFSGMPTGGSALGLNSAEANAVRTWINNGAQ